MLDIIALIAWSKTFQSHCPIYCGQCEASGWHRSLYSNGKESRAAQATFLASEQAIRSSAKSL